MIPEFINQVNIALESLSKSTVHLFDDNQFVDISKKVYDTIHNIRCSVMMIRVSLSFILFMLISEMGQDGRAFSGALRTVCVINAPKLISRLNWPGEFGLQWNVWL